MDQFGEVNLRWSAGYNGGSIYYTDAMTIAHVSGNCIRFLNTEDNEEKFLESPGDGIGAFAVNTVYNTVAISEVCIDARIFVYDVSDFSKTRSVLKGAGTLGCSALAFANNGSLLASYAEDPDCTLTLWNWPDEIRIGSIVVTDFICTQLSFNPLNWRQVCGTNDTQMFVWNIEQLNETYNIITSKVTLPIVDGIGVADPFDDLHRQISRSVSPISSNIRITRTAIAGIVGDEQGKMELVDKRKRCSPKGHCWGQNGQIFCCCSDGQILAINAETQAVTLFYNPAIQDSLLEDILVENRSENPPDNPLEELAAGSVDCFALHQNGLFAAGQDGCLRCIRVDTGDLKIADRIKIGSTIKSMCWSPGYDALALGTNDGSVLVYYPDESHNLYPMFQNHNEKIVGIDCTLGEIPHCVTCRENGLLQVWSIASPNLVAQLQLPCKATTMKCVPSSNSVIIGTIDGKVMLVDIREADKPRLVFEKILHKGPLTALSIDNMGQIIVTGSTDEHIFIIDAKASTGLYVIGYTRIEGEARKISCLHCKEEEYVTILKVVIGVGHAEDGAEFNRLVGLDLSTQALRGSRDSYLDMTGLFRDGAIMKRSYLIRNAISDICLVSKNNAYAIQAKTLVNLPIPVPEEGTGNVVLDPSMGAQGHGLKGGCISASTHLRWLATGAPDGKLILRATGAIDHVLTVSAGHRKFNGITHCCFSPNSKYMITAGGDGTLSCWGWDFNEKGKGRSTAAVNACKARLSQLADVRREQDAVLKEMQTFEPEVVESDEWTSEEIQEPHTPSTWLDFSVSKAHDEEDQKYKEAKHNLRNDIGKLRRNVLDMIEINESAPELEKLERHEFNMDLEGRAHLLGIREEQIRQLRNEIEEKNLAKQYVRNLVKKQCWDEMITKGRSIKAFYSTMEVTNYPMRERTKAELEELEFVTQERKFEIAEEQARKTTLDPQIAANPPLIEEQNREDDELPEDDRKRKESPAIVGSLSHLYGGDNELLRSQFTLHTSQEKQHQIVLLQDCIYRMKVQFNKKFDMIFRAKEIELKKITDRNVRIKKIVKDLELDEEMFEPQWTSDEKPEMLLEVKDDEVTVEKYISEEEQKRLDGLAEQEKERRKLEKADNARERALEMMMHGRLEANLEEELKKELVKPAFMSKPKSEWTEEEHKMEKEFEKKEQKLKEDREKFRKTLEAELRKLQGNIAEAATNFDEKLSQLFQRKVKTEMVICQEELKILRLASSLLMKEELNTREKQLLQSLEEKKVLKQNSSLLVAEVKREVDKSKDTYDIYVAEDKTLDKNFRREFADQDQHTIDALYRLFKRRPRAQKTLKAAVESQADVSTNSRNPFQARPSSSRALALAAATLDKAMSELDDDQHMPEGLNYDTWRKLVALRRLKVEKEQQVKAKALVLAEMNSIYQKRVVEDERLKNEVENVFKELQRLREDRLTFNLNLEVQLLLKQGQVEVPTSSFITDYSDSILIHHSVVEDLNATIKTLGETKLASMKDSKEFRKGIYQLEWDHKKMRMQAEDLQTMARDIQLLRVTKELQAFLGEGDHNARLQQEVATLEQTLELHKKMHKRNVTDKLDALKRFKRLIKKKEDENTGLDVRLEDLSLSVAERRNVSQTNDDERNDTAAEKRMQDIITRRKLVDLAKAQAQEIAILRAEVERLRMRTFPALVQIDQQ